MDAEVNDKIKVIEAELNKTKEEYNCLKYPCHAVGIIIRIITPFLISNIQTVYIYLRLLRVDMARLIAPNLPFLVK